MGWLERLLPFIVIGSMVLMVVWGRRKGLDRHEANMTAARAEGAAELAASLANVVNVSVGNVNSPGAEHSGSEHEAVSRRAVDPVGLLRVAYEARLGLPNEYDHLDQYDIGTDDDDDDPTADDYARIARLSGFTEPDGPGARRLDRGGARPGDVRARPQVKHTSGFLEGSTEQ